MLQQLYDHRLVFVTGKGGVGKSSCTAAMALQAARSGKKVLICEIDAISAIGPLLGADKPVVHEPAELAPGVHACNIDGDLALAATLLRFVPSRRVARALVVNKVTRLFFHTAPSAIEISIFYRMKHLLDHGGYDLVLVDLPATGHAISFLAVPQSMHKLLRVGSLAEMSGELAQAIRDPQHTALAVVALPEEMPVNETIELQELARKKLGLSAEVVLVNMVRQAPISADRREALAWMAARVKEAGSEAAPGLAELVRAAVAGLATR